MEISHVIDFLRDLMMDIKKIEDISKLVRYYIITATTKAGSGHLTSSLSAVELMAVLFLVDFLDIRLLSLNILIMTGSFFLKAMHPHFSIPCG